MKSKGILIIGSGVVGQAKGKAFAKKGYPVTFIDIDVDIIHKLKQEGFDACLPGEFSGIADISIFALPTPIQNGGNGNVNLDYITTAIIEHSKWLAEQNSWHLIVIESTVPPGTTRKILLPLFEMHSGKSAGTDFGLCANPEFMRAQSGLDDCLNPWITVIGELDRHSGDVLEKVYANFGDKNKIYRVDIEIAEFVKYINNSFKATKISFSNEVWLLAKKLGIDGNRALELVTESAEGCFNPHYGTVGGQPFRGSCLPKDINALLALSQKIGVDMPLLSAVISVNNQMENLADQGVVPPAITTGLKWKPTPNLPNEERGN